MTYSKLLGSTLLFIASLAGSLAHAAPVFVDWTAADSTANTASGTANSIGVALTTTANPPSGFDANGGIAPGSTLNGTFGGFANPAVFTPSVALTDAIVLNSSSSFLFTFDAPVTNLTLHLFQLANTTVTFDSPFTLQSSDGDLLAVGNTITGPAASVDDGNGSLLFAGTLTSLSWTATVPNVNDGVLIQFSFEAAPAPATAPEPATLALLGLAAAMLGLRRRLRLV